MEILWISLGACGIALIVFLLKKFVPGLKNNEENKEETSNEENNVDRYVVPFEGEGASKTSDEEVKQDEQK